MSKQQALLAGASAGALLLLWAPAGALAQTAAGSTTATLSEIVVTADKAGLLEKKPNDTVFGLNKPLVDTARSATLITDTTIERYGIKTIDNLVAIAPGTFTASSVVTTGGASPYSAASMCQR